MIMLARIYFICFITFILFLHIIQGNSNSKTMIYEPVQYNTSLKIRQGEFVQTTKHLLANERSALKQDTTESTITQRSMENQGKSGLLCR